MAKRGGRSHLRQPQVVVTLVHGTFARDAAWTRPDSALCKALLDAGCHLVRFEWSGRNSHRARSHAAQALADHLAQQIEEHPRAWQWIVAHSHGGNVALHAAQDLRRSRQGASKVSTVALATPFIHSRARVVRSWLVFITVLFVPLLLFIAGAKVVAGPRSFLDWMLVVFGAVVIADMLLCAVGALMHGGLFRSGYRHRLITSMHSPAVEAEDFVVVRAAGDEASGFLAAGQFVGWISGVLTQRLTGVLVWGLILIVVNGAVLLSAVLGLRIGVYAMTYVFPIPGLAVLGAVAMMLGASIVFGIDGPFVSLFASSSAEPAPPGRATLLQLEPFAAAERRGLAHSRLYDDEQVIRVIVDTICRSLQK